MTSGGHEFTGTCLYVGGDYEYQQLRRQEQAAERKLITSSGPTGSVIVRPR